jgi:hypothetical protein
MSERVCTAARRALEQDAEATIPLGVPNFIKKKVSFSWPFFLSIFDTA